MNHLLGNKLRALREESGMTQEQVAEILGMSRQKYARIEKGVNDITLEILVRVAELYQIEVADITKVLESKRPEPHRMGDGNHGTVDRVYEMLDLFYANKHLYERMNVEEDR